MMIIMYYLRLASLGTPRFIFAKGLRNTARDHSQVTAAQCCAVRGQRAALANFFVEVDGFSWIEGQVHNTIVL